MATRRRRLFVKTVAVGGAVADVAVDVADDASVQEMKAAIAVQHPQRPAPAAQKLFFGGRLLRDTDRLDVVLERLEPDGVATFHLLFAPGHAPQTAEAKAVAAPSAPAPAPSPVSATSAGSAAIPDSARPAAPAVVATTFVPCVVLNGVPYAVVPFYGTLPRLPAAAEWLPAGSTSAEPDDANDPAAAAPAPARAGPAAAAFPDANDGEPNGQPPRTLMGALSLLVRLGIFVFLLTRGADTNRIVAVSCIAVAYFLNYLGLFRWPTLARRRLRHRADALAQAARSVAAPGDLSRPDTPAPAVAVAPARRTVLQEVGRWVVPFVETLLPFGDHALVERPHPPPPINPNPNVNANRPPGANLGDGNGDNNGGGAALDAR